jgi:O-antigen ligase
LHSVEPGRGVPAASRRRRRHHAVPISVRRSVVDWIAISLLLLPSLVGIYLFGAVRLWSICPLMFAAALGMVLFFLRPFFGVDLRRIQVPPGGVLWLLVLAYVAVMIPRGSVPYDARIEVLKLASYLGAYWAWSELAAHYKRWRFLLGLLIFAVTMIAWYAMIQQSHGTRMVLNLERPEEYGMRASGTYFCPNHFAHLLEVVIPLCFALTLTSSAGVPLRLLASYGLVLSLPVMFLTQSRSGWIGTVVGLSTVICMIGARKGRKVFLVTLLFVPLVFAAAGVGLWMFSDIFRERILDAFHGNIRLRIWSDTLAMIRSQPWLGWGAGSYQWVFPRFRTISEQMLFNYAHNEYLHFAADYGIIAIALFALVVLAACGKLFLAFLKTERDRDAYLIAGLFGCLAATFAHAMFDFNLHIFSNNHVILLIAGTTVACLYASGHWQSRSLKAPAWLLVYGGGALAALILALSTAQVFLSYGLHYLGEQRREKFQMTQADSLFDKAIVIDPGNWRPYLSKAHILMTQSFWNFDAEAKARQAQASMELYNKALARNPYDLEIVFGLGKAYNVLGEPEKALDCLRRAAAADPEHMFYASHLGLQLRRMGRDQEALDVFRKAAAKWNDEMITLNIQALEKKLAQAATNAPAQ